MMKKLNYLVFFIAIFAITFLVNTNSVSAQATCWDGTWTNPTCNPTVDPNCNVDPPLFQDAGCLQGTELFRIYDTTYGITDAGYDRYWVDMGPGYIQVGEVQGNYEPKDFYDGTIEARGPVIIGAYGSSPSYGATAGGLAVQGNAFFDNTVRIDNDLRINDLVEAGRLEIDRGTNRYIDNSGYLVVDDYVEMNDTVDIGGVTNIRSAIATGNILDVHSTRTSTAGSDQFNARLVIHDEDSALPNGGFLKMENYNNIGGTVPFGGGDLFWDPYGFLNATNDYQIRIDADQTADSNDHEFRLNNGSNRTVFTIDEAGNASSTYFCLDDTCIGSWDDASVGGQTLQEVLDTGATANTTYQTNINGDVSNAVSVLRLDNTYSSTNRSLKTLEVEGGGVIMTGTSGLDSRAINVIGGQVQNSDTTSYGVYIQGGDTVSASNYSYGLYVTPGTGSGNEYAAYFDGNVQIANGTLQADYLTNTGAACGADQLLVKDGTGTNWTCQSSTGVGSYWTLNGNDLYPNSTAYLVGVGNSNPLYPLDVSGRIRHDGATLFTDRTNPTVTTTNTYGAYTFGYNMYFQPGAELAIGGGEGASAMISQGLAAGGTENLYLGADADIYMYTGLQSGNDLGIFINDDGRVMVGTNSPSTSTAFYVAGTAFATHGWYTGSDVRYKKNFERLSGVLEKIDKINSYYYDMRVDEFPEMNWDKDRQLGLIAQELEKEFPELVRTDENGYKSVLYDRITAILWEAIKEQQVEVDNINQRLEVLENKLK